MRIDGPWRGDIASATVANPAPVADVDSLVEGHGFHDLLIIEPRLCEVFPLAPARIALLVTGLGRGNLLPLTCISMLVE